MNLPLVLEYLRPGAEWSLSGDSYDGLTWLDSSKKPTLAQVQAAESAALAAERKRKGEAARRADFEVEADPLFFGWQRGENTEKQWRDKVAEIRSRHPY